MLKTHFFIFIFRVVLSSAVTSCSKHCFIKRELFHQNNTLIEMLHQKKISHDQPYSKHLEHNMVNFQKKVTFTKM